MARRRKDKVRKDNTPKETLQRIERMLREKKTPGRSDKKMHKHQMTGHAMAGAHHHEADTSAFHGHVRIALFHGHVRIALFHGHVMAGAHHHEASKRAFVHRE